MIDAVRPLEEGEVEALQALLQACTGYAQQVTGYPTGPSDALSTLLQLPEGRTPEDKTVLGAWSGLRLVACADLLVRHPDERTATLGLLLVHPDERRAGIGRSLHDVAAAAARARGARRIRVAVVDTAAASVPFWDALGYRSEGDAVPYRYDHLESTVRHWIRALPPLEDPGSRH